MFSKKVGDRNCQLRLSNLFEEERDNILDDFVLYKFKRFQTTRHKMKQVRGCGQKRALPPAITQHTHTNITRAISRSANLILIFYNNSMNNDLIGY